MTGPQALLVEPDGTLRWASPALAHLLRMRQDHLVGRALLDLVDGADAAAVVDRLDHLNGGGGCTTVGFRLHRPGDPAGSGTPVLGSMATLPAHQVAPAGADRAILLCLRPTRDRHDELTGLADRGLLLERLAAAAARTGGFALVLLDLDAFRRVNDGLGHLEGDRLLAAVAGRLRCCAPAAGVPAPAPAAR